MASDPRPPGPVLGFDTSAAHCAAALVSGGTVLAERHEPMPTGQAEWLFPILESVLAEAGLGWRDLGGIGAGTGPGNFTGIRIAVAAARGLALSLGVPAVGVTRFEAEALGAPRPCVALIDARRGQVYLQRLPDGAPALAPREAVASLAAGLAVVSGGGEPGTLMPAEPLAVAIAHIAAARIAAGGKLPRPVPLYVRPADAAPPREPAPHLAPGNAAAP